MKRKRLTVDFVELHILHHASESPIYGLWMMEELGRHGYRLNASQLYPKFHRLERRGLIGHRKNVINGKLRKYYQVTARGRRYWASQKRRLIELVSEALSAVELRAALRSRR
ncbi:MAG: PadR family transcriptional regulator [Vicinamibacteria bacterium]